MADGHSLQEILLLTVKQIVFLKMLSVQRRKSELVVLAGAVRAAVNANKKQFGEFIEEMDDG